MKTGLISFFGRRTISGLFLAGAIVLLTNCKKDNNNNTSANYTVSGNANGSQVVPPTDGNGNGTISGSYNPETRTLIYTSTWTNLSGPPTMASFYSGAAGVVGTIVGAAWNLGANLTATGSTTDTLTLSSEQAADLTSGKWYYTYSTTAFPSGEIRGQVTAIRQ
jgi:hypothetical protein